MDYDFAVKFGLAHWHCKVMDVWSWGVKMTKKAVSFLNSFIYTLLIHSFSFDLHSYTPRWFFHSHIDYYLHMKNTDVVKKGRNIFWLRGVVGACCYKIKSVWYLLSVYSFSSNLFIDYLFTSDLLIYFWFTYIFLFTYIRLC